LCDHRIPDSAGRPAAIPVFAVDAKNEFLAGGQQIDLVSPTLVFENKVASRAEIMRSQRGLRQHLKILP
jgi:hypothetical protein